MKPSSLFKLLIAVFFILFLVYYFLAEKNKLDSSYGISQPVNRIQNLSKNTSTASSEGQINYHNDVKPILNKRCVVCHGCYDAPCQLKLTSTEGLERGASKDKVYNAIRLKAAKPSRLFEDAQNTKQWRENNFYPVLNEREQNPQANLDASVMAQMLILKQMHPLPDETPLPDSFDFTLKNANNCPTIEEFPDFAQQKPLWGMPYGLPKLSPNEYRIFMQWLMQGAHHEVEYFLSQSEQRAISQWETFLNNDSLKHQLMSRYIYEHLYIARIYFTDSEQNSPQQKINYYRLIRSKTPPGEKPERIVTRRPYDDPDTERVYYRLVIDHSTLLDKTNMPYRFDAQRMQRYQELFINEDYQLTQLPDYSLKSALNPFVTFADIPPRSRYKFLLDEAKFSAMGFIKGPVCRGQIALNVIQDHFWVFFVDPDLEIKEPEGRFLTDNLKYMNLPAQDSSTASISNWFKYGEDQKQFLYLKSRLIDKNIEQFDLSTLWNGGKEKNTNAALTIFRHFDSASVIQGLLGKKPKTAWVVDYSLLERVHYLLVAGFDVYGNYGHQLNTRLYMDFLRMEGEFNLLAFLPQRSRLKVSDEWYAQADREVKDYLHGQLASLQNESALLYKSSDHKNELLEQIRDYMNDALNARYQLSDSDNDKQLSQLEKLIGKNIALLPQLMFLLLEDEEGKESAYTLIHNNAHLNISHLFNEGSRRISDEDTLTIAKGFIGSYPNVFFKVRQLHLRTFVETIKTMRDESDYLKLLDDFAVRRNDKQFWSVADKFHALHQKNQPHNAGLFDFNRLENK